jgi:signal transduction histidine kinase
MRFSHSLARTAGFSSLYLVATYLGRLTVMDSTNLSLVWPAAGVLAVWFVAQRESRWRWLDACALAVITMTVNTATGASMALAGCFVVANLVQAYVFTALFGRWLPGLWGGSDGGQPLSRLSQLWRLVAAAVASTSCGALIGPTAVWALSGHYSWESALVWLTRNAVSILLIGVASRRIGYLVVTWWRRRQTPATDTGWWRSLPTAKRIEYAALVAASALAYYVLFGLVGKLPVAFALIAVTVWAGLRMHTTFVVLHDLVFGTVAILFTLHGLGPFAMIGSHPIRALVAQLFVGTVAVVGLALALSRDERDVLTTRLREQAQLMTAVVESMNEGIGVVDENGRFLLRNPAVGRLLGGVTSTSGVIEPSSYYGLYYPDGTPIPENELPYRRVLAGEQVAAMDVLIRNAGVPQGRLVNLNTALMPGQINGLRHAVVALHDVTADRRHRDELANFAGVVAHDLLNPLATVEGWTEILHQDLDDRHGPTAAGLDRIQRAATRMRALINDLLSYTTSRDANLSPTTVDLNALVGDITAGRVDHAQGASTYPPVFRVGDLGAVNADPALVRQLLENLIGNAIKYTAPDVTPHITITAGIDDAKPWLTQVELTDNGIGIPAGQHDAVFNNFHRAHLDADYSGTGLGLAICKRIVERHGGTITASDSPSGHGTRITFTVPKEDMSSTIPEGTQPVRVA